MFYISIIKLAKHLIRNPQISYGLLIQDKLRTESVEIGLILSISDWIRVKI